MEQELHITKAVHFDKKKDGSSFVDKNGKNYWNVRINTNEYGDRQLSGFVWEQLKEGQTIKAVVKENGQYLNFDIVKEKKATGVGITPDQYRAIMQELQAIKVKVIFILSHVDPQAHLTSAGTKVPDFSEVDFADNTQR